MRTYQLILTGGLTRNIEAKGYSRGERGVVFVLEDGSTLCFVLNEVIMIEEIREDVSPSVQSSSDHWGDLHFAGRLA
jgi:hypothetical protein